MDIETSMLSKNQILVLEVVQRLCANKSILVFKEAGGNNARCQRCNSEDEPFNTYYFSARGLYKYGILLNLNVENK